MDIDWLSLPPSLIVLLRGYATLCPLRYLRFPSELPFTQIHRFLLDAVLTHPYFATYPPTEQYQQQFWKWAIEHLESMPLGEDDEIDSRMYEYHVSLMSRSIMPQGMGSRLPAPSYFTYFWKPTNSLKYESATLVESRTTIESGTTGLKTWRASLVLAQYLILNPEMVRNKKILELGSGVGFLGIIAAALHMSEPEISASICLTDVNSEVLARCAGNLALASNRSACHPALKICPLDWTDSQTEVGISATKALLEEASPDLILGADVVYDPSIITPLVETLHLALQGDAKIALIALTERNQDTLLRFTQAASSRLILEEVSVHLVDAETFWGIADFGHAVPDQRVKIFQLQYKSA